MMWLEHDHLAIDADGGIWSRYKDGRHFHGVLEDAEVPDELQGELWWLIDHWRDGQCGYRAQVEADYRRAKGFG